MFQKIFPIFLFEILFVSSTVPESIFHLILFSDATKQFSHYTRALNDKIILQKSFRLMCSSVYECHGIYISHAIYIFTLFLFLFLLHPFHPFPSLTVLYATCDCFFQKNTQIFSL